MMYSSKDRDGQFVGEFCGGWSDSDHAHALDPARRAQESVSVYEEETFDDADDDDDLDDAFDVIGEMLGPVVERMLYDGMSEGTNPQWNYDAQLVHDIAQACESWSKRSK